MSVEQNKAIVRRFFDEICNQGNLDVADEIFDTNFVNHDAAHPELFDLESCKQWVATVRTVFPDFHVTIEDIIAEGDKVAVRYTTTGTHKSEFMGIPPTGKQVRVTGMRICRFASGKMVESWANSDTLGVMQQLGVIPPMGQGEK